MPRQPTRHRCAGASSVSLGSFASSWRGPLRSAPAAAGGVADRRVHAKLPFGFTRYALPVPTEYRTRAVDPLIRDLLEGLPALLLVGPRAVGKTTTARRHVSTMVSLDDEVRSAALRADADTALRRLTEPVLLDEWQEVPSVLGAVKRTLDRDPRAGRFLLTGSVNAELEAQTWPGTGRLVRTEMYGLTIAEQNEATAAAFLDRVAEGDPLQPPRETPDLRGYIDLAVRSGFPDALRDGVTDMQREYWLEGYVSQLVTRDARNASGQRDPVLLRRFLEAYALNTAGVTTDKRVYDAAGVTRVTAGAYERLLRNLWVVDNVPAWTSNRLKRLVRAPKRYVVDVGVLCGAHRLGVDDVMTDGDLLGRVLDTFVMSQLRPECTWARSRPALFHLRDEGGRHEVDIVAELRGQTIVGIEVKATGAPRSAAARHLVWLRDQLGDRFARGVVLHTGTETYELDDRIVAAPISTLWA